MSKDINREMDEMATKLEKSAKSPSEILFDTIREIGPEGLRKALPTLNESEQALLKSTLEDMKKAVSMDDEYAAKYISGKITDTKLQEEVANDDQDEKLVKPEAAKMNHQGTPTEGWEGQVIKADKLDREAAKETIMQMEEKEHGTKDPKKVVEAEKQEDSKKDGMKEKLKEMKKAIESELGSKATPELVKSEMKKRLLAEENQLGDAPDMDGEKTRADKEEPKALKLGADNEDAQKKVNDLSQGQEGSIKKSASWTTPNSLLNARTGGRNHHFSVNEYYDEVLKTPAEEVKKSEPSVKEDLNDIIAKGGDTTWGNLETDRLVKSNQEKQTGRLTKSFVDADLAEAFGMTEEEVKKILGE